MEGRSELPAEVAKRVRRHRARLDGRGVRFERGDRPFSETLDDIDRDTSGVLIVDALPRGEGPLRQAMVELRRRLEPGREVRVVQRSRPLASSPARRIIGRVVGGPDPDRLDDVPAAIRSSGYAIGSIERFEIESGDGPAELWVDLIALDLSAGSGDD